MQAVQAAIGQPLTMHEVADPALGAHDVLIEVRAAGLNQGDLLQRAGLYPPPPGASDVLGLEVAGVVLDIGDDVEQWTLGDRVCALLPGGGYAELAMADEGSVFPIPGRLDFAQAACLPEAMMTVWANVFLRCGLEPGESFLMHGGTSGIGVLGIQMAVHAGAGPVFATAGTDEKTAVCDELGADVAINYQTQDFVEIVTEHGGADVILDMVGGDYIQRNITAAKIDGRICNIAYQGGFDATVDFGPVLMKRLVLTATTLRARSHDQKRHIRDAVLTDFWPAIADGRITPLIDSTFPMGKAEEAQDRLQRGGHIGKIVLER